MIAQDTGHPTLVCPPQSKKLREAISRPGEGTPTGIARRESGWGKTLESLNIAGGLATLAPSKLSRLSDEALAKIAAPP